MIQSILSANWPGRDEESLVWLASYPRSGNTFTRILLANYLAGDGEAYPLNKLQEFISSDIGTAVWETPQPPSESWETLWKARPAAIARYRKTKEPQRFPCLKTHTANVKAFGSSGFDFRPNDRAIYVVRHPLDVLLSFADFNNKDIDSAIAVMTQSGFTVQSGLSGNLELRGSWVEHVTSWIEAPPCPIFLMRYEELGRETAETFRALLTFLGIPVVEERVQLAIAASRFDKVREQESADRFVERSATSSSGRFFREGKSLQWLRQLAPEQAYRLADACKDVMRQLGYTYPRNVMFDGRNALGSIQLDSQNLKPDSISSL